MTTAGSTHAPDQLRVLTAAQVRDLLSWPDLIDASRQALIALANSSAPAGASTQVAVPGASLHLKAGALLTPPILSVKANLRPDQGSSSGAILVFDHQAQRLEAIMASADLTAMRTGAIAAVAADSLHPDRNPVVALIGAGPVARMTLRALRHVLTPAEVRVWSRNCDRAHQLADEDGSAAVSESVAEAAQGASLVITCTPSREPLLFRENVVEHVVVLAMGADSPGKRELGPGLLDGATVFADVLADALNVGECAHMTTGQADVQQLGEHLQATSRIDTPQPVSIFDSVGSSAVDAAAVGLILAAARAQDIGSRLTLT